MIENSRISLNRIICPSLELEDFFKLTAELGLNKVELRNDLPGRGIIDGKTPLEVNDLCRKYNIRILTINALQKFNLAKNRSMATDELKQLIDLALAINCPAIVLCPNNDTEDPRDPETIFKETAAALKSFAPLFEESGMRGYVEPLGFAESSTSSLITAMQAIQESGSPNYRLVHDTFHHYLGPDNLDELKRDYDISYTGIVHMSGVESSIPRLKFRDEHRVMITAADRMKNLDQIAWLQKCGYRGDFSFEPFAREVQNLNTVELKLAVGRSIDFINR
ncbi:MAG: TIM barrel protein [Spirochaeta sp.]|nr:TIM barrel protein [Spirochaeta sp.]